MVAAAAMTVLLLACLTAEKHSVLYKQCSKDLPRDFEAQHNKIKTYRYIFHESGVFEMHAWRALRSPAHELGR